MTGPSFRISTHRLAIVDELAVKYGARHISYSYDDAHLIVSAGTSKNQNLFSFPLRAGRSPWTFQTAGSSAEIVSLPSGRILAASGVGRIGDGSSEIAVFTAEGGLLSRTILPDKLSEVRCSHDRIYAGCRNGYLYCFNEAGERIWDFLVPQDRAVPSVGDTFRPCPYFVQVPADEAGVVFSSWGSLYRLGRDGVPRWRWISEPRNVPWQSNVAFATSGYDTQHLSTLGLSTTPTEEDLRRAFRRRALDTHPDRHPANPNAGAEFRAVMEAYEALMGGLVSGGYAPTSPIGIGFAIPTTVYGLAVAASGCHVLTSLSDGSLIRLDERGMPEYRLVAHEGAGQLVANSNLSSAVYSSWGGLSFYSGRGLVSSYPSETFHRLRISHHGSMVAAWSAKKLLLFDLSGRLIADMVFAQHVHDVAFNTQDEMAVSAGRVFRIQAMADSLSAQ